MHTAVHCLILIHVWGWKCFDDYFIITFILAPNDDSSEKIVTHFFCSYFVCPPLFKAAMEIVRRQKKKKKQYKRMDSFKRLGFFHWLTLVSTSNYIDRSKIVYFYLKSNDTKYMSIWGKKNDS